MKLSTLVAIALAALLVTAGAVAAVPSHASANEQAPDRGDAGEPGVATADDDRRPGGPASQPERRDRSDDDASARGPPETLPEQVPDHVAEVHDRIRRFLSGDLGGPLGESVSDVTPGNAPGSAADASG
jgi:hypothetical protein